MLPLFPNNQEMLTLSSYAKQARTRQKTARPGLWKDVLQKMISMRPGWKRKPKILEIGCGTGNEAALFAGQPVEYVGIDAVPEMIEVARELHPDLDFRQMSVYELDFFADGQFDYFFSIQTLHHIPLTNIDRVMKLIARKLVAGGVGFVTIRHEMGVGERMVVEDGLERLFVGYTKSLWLSVLQDGGFEFEKAEADDRDYSPPTSKKRRLCVWLRKRG